MPIRGKEAIPLFRILSFFDKNSKSGQDLGTRARSSEAK